MSRHALLAGVGVAVALFSVGLRAHALGHEDPPQPGDLSPLRPARNAYRAGLGVGLVFPLGGASRQTDHSLGWRARLVRWLGRGFGLTASLGCTVLAKDAILPDDVDLYVRSAHLGVRWESKRWSGHSLFAEASGILEGTRIVNRGRQTTRTSRGSGLSAGASTRVAPRVYAVLRLDYTAARHRMATIELGFSVDF